MWPTGVKFGGANLGPTRPASLLGRAVLGAGGERRCPGKGLNIPLFLLSLLHVFQCSYGVPWDHRAATLRKSTLRKVPLRKDSLSSPLRKIDRATHTGRHVCTLRCDKIPTCLWECEVQVSCFYQVSPVSVSPAKASYVSPWISALEKKAYRGLGGAMKKAPPRAAVLDQRHCGTLGAHLCEENERTRRKR